MLARVDTPLKRILIDEGRSQAWLARKISELLGRDVDPNQVWGWVHGLHRPEQETRVAIADALRRTVDELWPADDAPEELAA